MSSNERHQIEKQFRNNKDIKMINRIVRGISIVNDTFDFPRTGYRITYPQAIIFHFDDCNLVIQNIEKL